MIRTDDGLWVIAERTDDPHVGLSLYDVPSECQRCGVRVYGAQGRVLHDGFHERVGP